MRFPDLPPPARSAAGAASAAALAALVVLSGSCRDRVEPTAPEAPGETVPAPPPQAATLGNGPMMAFTCEADVRARELACAPSDASSPAVRDGPDRVIVGGQDSLLTLTSSNISYDPDAQVFQADVTVKSMIGQAFGTADGSTVTGLRVFFHSGPTGDAGTVTVANPDNTGAFTGSGQPYFEYSEILEDGQTSSPRNWKWSLGATTTSFTFEVFVDGDVPNPSGWVEVTPEGVGIPSDGSTATLTAQAKDVVGRDVAGRSYTWSTPSGDVSLSAPTGSSIQVSSTTSGATATVTASSDGTEADGTASVTVDGSDMAVTELRVGPDPVGVGGTLEWDLTIANRGPTAVTGVHAEIDITGPHVDAGSFLASTSGGSCGWTTDNATFITFDCDMGDLSAGGTSSVTWTVEPRGSGAITVDASILSITSGGTDNNPSNDALQRSVTVSSGPNLEAGALTITPSTATTAQTVDIDGSITNTGDQAAGAYTWRLVVDGTTVASGSEASLGAGATFAGADVTGIGPYADVGGRKAQLVVDPDDQVAEASETDNVTDDNLVVKGSGYDIELVFLTGFTASEEQLFTDAAARWSSVVTGDLTDRTNDLSAACGLPLVHGVDDVVIFIQEVAIDGPSNTLASAGPCYTRGGPDSPLSLTGVINMDSGDFDDLVTNNEAGEVITHEMGHVLGIGSLWDNTGLLSGARTSDPFFTGTEADNRYDANGGGGASCYPGDPAVPVANTGGSGTADSHWRESYLDTEMMTGYAESAGTTEELSVVTVGSLQDIGYTVDFASTEIDAYTVPCSGSPAPPAAPPAEAPAPFDEVLGPQFEVMPDGEIRPIGSR